ncbi:MAG: hypothetical protein D4R64_13070 [Porphyromonadaceae bacterium]|nr:MAG: hypothetical protein D4R64_13070 [Porphyromonadaceae bacterium]
MTDLILWKTLHNLGQELFSLKPWVYLDEIDIFGVKSPETDKEYFISIMGSNHKVYALSAYEGAAAIGRFWDIQNSNGTLPPETILTIPHFMISLIDRQMVPDDQAKLIKQLGLLYRGKNGWLTFHRVDPGMFPATPDSTKLNDLRFILEQSIDVIRRAIVDQSLIYPEDDAEEDYLFRVAAINGESLEWSDLHRVVTFPNLSIRLDLDPSLFTSLNSIAIAGNFLQVDLILLANPIREKGIPPYFPFALVLVDGKTGFVYGVELIRPLPDYDALLSSIPEVLLQKLIDVRFHPSSIKYRHPDLKIIMEFIGQQANIRIEFSPKLPALDKAMRSLMAKLQSSR